MVKRTTSPRSRAEDATESNEIDTEATNPRRRGAARKALMALGVLLLVLALALGGVFLWLNNKLDSQIAREGLLPGQGGQTTSQGDVEGLHQNADGSVTDAEGNVYATADGKSIKLPMSYGSADSKTIKQPTRVASQKNSLNMLIIGTDAQGGERGRSDVMILAHISDDRKRVDLIHFPRDLWSTIPGKGAAKLNAAYAYGGAPLLVETIQPMLGVPIDHVALVNFDGFQQMTDALGGVTVGGRKMNGEEALAWVRERKALAQGDISRGQRQMEFTRAVILDALKPEVLMDPQALNRYLNAATGALTVDDSLSTGEMRKLAVELRNVRSNSVTTLTAPWSGIGWAKQQSIVVPAPEQMDVLKKALQNDAMSGYQDTVSPTKGFGR